MSATYRNEPTEQREARRASKLNRNRHANDITVTEVRMFSGPYTDPYEVAYRKSVAESVKAAR